MKSIERSGNWNSAFAGLGSLSQQQTTSTSTTNGNATVFGSGGTATGTYNGTTTTTSTQPDYEARRRATERIDRIRANANNAIQNIQSTVLRPNTILPGKQLIGIVYFEREKHISEAVLTVVIGNDTFAIPFSQVTAK